jgi:hypothetical protein
LQWARRPSPEPGLYDRYGAEVSETLKGEGMSVVDIVTGLASAIWKEEAAKLADAAAAAGKAPIAPKGAKPVEDFLPEAQRRLEATEAKYPGMEGVNGMAKKPDIKFINDLQKELKLTDTQRELLHEAITGQNLTKKEIRQVAQEIQELYPNK